MTKQTKTTVAQLHAKEIAYQASRGPIATAQLDAALTEISPSRRAKIKALAASKAEYEVIYHAALVAQAR